MATKEKGINQTEDTNDSTNKSKFMKYSGRQCPIPIKTWLKLFESIFNKPEQEIIFYLEDDALKWYGNNIAGTNIRLWATISQKLIEHFGTSLHSSLIEAQHRRLRLNETVLQYFDEKWDLLCQTSLTTSEKLECLTDGLPKEWQIQLAPTKWTVKTSDAWLQSVLCLEASLKTLRQKPKSPNHNIAKVHTARAQPQRFTRTSSRSQRQQPRQGSSSAPSPCKYCLQKMNLSCYHWHKDCPYLPSRTSSLSNEETNAAQQLENVTLN